MKLKALGLLALAAMALPLASCDNPFNPYDDPTSGRDPLSSLTQSGSIPGEESSTGNPAGEYAHVTGEVTLSLDPSYLHDTTDLEGRPVKGITLGDCEISLDRSLFPDVRSFVPVSLSTSYDNGKYLVKGGIYAVLYSKASVTDSVRFYVQYIPSDPSDVPSIPSIPIGVDCLVALQY